MGCPPPEGGREPAALFNTRVRLLPTVAAALLVAAACAAPAGRATADPFAGEYLAVTSESAVPVAERLTAAFASLHRGMHWTVRDVGATATLTELNEGQADVGFLSRALTVEDAQYVHALGLGHSAQVVIVNPANPLADLTTAQLRAIFSGVITDWSAVGGTPGPIRVFLRPESSPTRAALDPLLRAPGGAYRPDATVLPNAVTMLSSVAADPAAIGMVSQPHLAGRPDARALAVEGVAPSRANVASGAYAYRRPITLIVRSNESAVRPGALAFRDWVHSEEGQRILRELF